MSEFLTPANEALCRTDPLERLRLSIHADYTPTTQDIARFLPFVMEQLVQAEEYGHPVLDKEEAIKRAQDRVNLYIDALKVSVITEVKCRRGDWIATA